MKILVRAAAFSLLMLGCSAWAQSYRATWEACFQERPFENYATIRGRYIKAGRSNVRYSSFEPPEPILQLSTTRNINEFSGWFNNFSTNIHTTHVKTKAVGPQDMIDRFVDGESLGFLLLADTHPNQGGRLSTASFIQSDTQIIISILDGPHCSRSSHDQLFMRPMMIGVVAPRNQEQDLLIRYYPAGFTGPKYEFSDEGAAP